MFHLLKQCSISHMQFRIKIVEIPESLQILLNALSILSAASIAPPPFKATQASNPPYAFFSSAAAL